MVSLKQEEMITLPAFSAEFLLKTGRRLIQLGNSIQKSPNCIYVAHNKGIEFVLHNSQFVKTAQGF